MREFLDDIEVGMRAVTPGRTITEADIVNFAGLSGDYHPLHTDAAYAAATRYGQRIAHGHLVLAVGSALLLRPGVESPIPKSFIAAYGMDRVRFPHPVRIGDTIHLETEVVAIEIRDAASGVLVRESRILNQHGDLCCVFTSRALCGRRP
ncbi:MAG: MaoC/PaaZ C-terminal domain-containing protein [Gammaproteobacteria bacterium]